MLLSISLVELDIGISRLEIIDHVCYVFLVNSQLKELCEKWRFLWVQVETG